MWKRFGQGCFFVFGFALTFLGVFINLEAKIPKISEVSALLSIGMGLILMTISARKKAS